MMPRKLKILIMKIYSKKCLWTSWIMKKMKEKKLETSQTGSVYIFMNLMKKGWPELDMKRKWWRYLQHPRKVNWWFNTSNYYRRWQKKKGPSVVIIRLLLQQVSRYFRVSILRWSMLFLAAGLRRYFNEFILGRWLIVVLGRQSTTSAMACW